MAMEPPRETVREREIIERDPGGGPWGVIAAIIGAVVLVLLIWFLFAGMRDTGDGTDIEVPDQIEVDVNDGGDAGGGDADAGGGDAGGDAGADAGTDAGAGGGS